MHRTTEEENLFMYNRYGISEWREKVFVLGSDAPTVKAGIEANINNELIEMVKLPFPLFTRAYFSNYPAAKDFIEDPGFGYKLYMLSESEIFIFSEIMKNGGKDLKDKKQMIPNHYIVLSQLEIKLNSSLEELMGYYNYKSFPESYYKFLYIAQYIDTDLALKLNLKSASVFVRDGEKNGYDIVGKLRLLNPAFREVIVRKLGMYGYDRISIDEIYKEINLDVDKIMFIINKIIPMMFKSTGEMKSNLGVRTTIDLPSLNEYTNLDFRKKDFKAEKTFYLKNVLSEIEREKLSKLTKIQVHIYLAIKYYGWTLEQICRIFSVTVSDVVFVADLIKNEQLDIDELKVTCELTLEEIIYILFKVKLMDKNGDTHIPINLILGFANYLKDNGIIIPSIEILDKEKILCSLKGTIKSFIKPNSEDLDSFNMLMLTKSSIPDIESFSYSNKDALVEKYIVLLAREYIFKFSNKGKVSREKIDYFSLKILNGFLNSKERHIALGLEEKDLLFAFPMTYGILIKDKKIRANFVPYLPYFDLSHIDFRGVNLYNIDISNTNINSKFKNRNNFSL